MFKVCGRNVLARALGETEGEKEEGVGKLITEVVQVEMVSLIAKSSVGIVIAELCRYSPKTFSFFSLYLIGSTNLTVSE